MEELPPSQIVAEPLTDAVGRSFTVSIAAVVVLSPLIFLNAALY